MISIFSTHGDESFGISVQHELIQVETCLHNNEINQTLHLCLLCSIASSHAASEETAKEESWTGPSSITLIVERMGEIHGI